MNLPIKSSGGASHEIAVIGCGVIGVSWAALFASYGYPVRMWDVANDWQRHAVRALSEATEQLRLLGASGVGNVTYASTLQEAVRGADWVQESTPEALDVKGMVFRNITLNASTDAIIASSTSSFTWSQLAPLVENPLRLITAHPFNPPHLMPLVEVFAADESVGKRAMEFYRGLGRRPILLRRDATGHVANRLASALWREAVHIVAAGIADVADVD